MLEAVPINRLICKTTEQVVGIEYMWNTGEVSVLWCVATRPEIVRIAINKPINKQTKDMNRYA
jgi:hypothetical protein